MHESCKLATRNYSKCGIGFIEGHVVFNFHMEFSIAHLISHCSEFLNCVVKMPKHLFLY